jgi:hypothetical protein
MNRRTLPALLFAAVALAVALPIAVSLYRDHVADPGALWRNVYHDRHGHYATGLDVAVRLRSFDVPGLLSQIQKAQVWGPVNGLALGIVLAIGGFDHRLAIVPSLACWTAVIVLTALIACRLFRDNNILAATAAGVAVAFTTTSPALQLLARDVMLELPGTALSALAIFAFMRAAAAPENRTRWRVLALVLTVLFFLKANYFIMVVAALAIAWLTLPGRFREVVNATRTIAPSAAMLRRLLLDPLIIGAAIVAAAAVVIVLRGPVPYELFGRSVSLYPPRNVVTIAYALLFARAATSWWRARAGFHQRLSVATRALFYFLVVPIAVSFLLPQRLGVFLWFVGPTHAGASGGYSLGNAGSVYAPAFLEGFSVAPWAGWLALALFGCAMFRWRRFPAEGRAVFVFALLCTAVVLIHPQQQGRFLTTFLFAVWIGSGAGAASLIELVARGMWRGVAAAAVVVLLAVGLVRQQPNTTAAAATAIRRTSGPSDLQLAAAIRELIPDEQQVAIASTFGFTRLYDWPLIERCRCRIRADVFRIPAGDRAAVRDAATAWLQRAAANRLLVFDFPEFIGEVPVLGFDYARTSGIVDAVAAQELFTHERTIELPEFGGRVSVWRRR